VKYCIGSDVGGGTSLSILRTLGDAYKVSQLNNYAFSAYEALYSATLGAAKALNLDRFIGNLDHGKEADFIFINSHLDPHIAQRVRNTKNIEEELFVYITMGDERLIEQTYIAGKPAYTNPHVEGALLT